MSRIFFTADTHFSHDKVAALRGFASREEHDEAVVEAWNATVGPRDSVWLLGDVSISASPARWAPQVARLNGTVHLISGNHDGSHPAHRSAHRAFAAYASAFASVASAARRRIEGREVLLSHFPYSGDHGAREDRYREFRLQDFGVPILHGHTHSGRALSTSSRGTLQVHVGWDTWSRPVSVDEIGALL